LLQACATYELVEVFLAQLAWMAASYTTVEGKFVTLKTSSGTSRRNDSNIIYYLTYLTL